MEKEKVNRKKSRLLRRVRNPLPLKKVFFKEKKAFCKECLITPRASGSSRCVQCTENYQNRI